jgi:hypothetical protein
MLGVLGLGLSLGGFAACSVGAGAYLSAYDNGPSAIGEAARAPRGKAIGIFGSAGAYDEGALLAFLQASSFEVTRVEMISSRLSGRTLAAFDIVIVDRLSRTFGAEEAETLAAWVHRGGSLMSLAGYVNDPGDWQRQNSLLAALPIHYAPGLIRMGDFGYATEFSEHPITLGLRSVPFWGGYRVAIAGTCEGPTQAVASIDGAPVAAACQHGEGRIFVWGDEWVEYSSQWTSTADVQRFWQNAIGWLAATG